VAAHRIYSIIDKHRNSQVSPKDNAQLLRELRELHLNISKENADDYITYLNIWREIRGIPINEQSMDAYMYAPY